MTVAFAMIGCGGDDDPVVPPPYVPPPPEKITISFDLQDGIALTDTDIGATLPADVEIDYGTALGVSLIDYVTYSGTPALYFEGWFNGADQVFYDTKLYGNTTLVGKFGDTDKRITLTFEGDSTESGKFTVGDIPAAVKIFPNDSLGAKFPGKVGYVLPVENTTDVGKLFDDWYVGTSRVTASTKFDADQTITAKFRTGVKVEFYEYANLGGTAPDPSLSRITVFVLEVGSSFDIDGIGEDFPAGPVSTQVNVEFGGWVLLPAKSAVTSETTFLADAIVVGTWNSTVLDMSEGSDAWEVLYLENGSYAIYEFTLPAGKTILDVTGLKASYMASEAGVKRGVRNLRLMGPYIYKDFITHIDTKAGNVPYYGDFVVDKNGAWAAKYIASGGASDYARDKNGPYINSNTGTTPAPNWAGDWQAAFGSSVMVEANKWIEASYPFNSATFTGTTVANVNGNAGAKVANASTEKVYFGIGVPNGNADPNATATIGTGGNGNIHLVKDVYLQVTGVAGSGVKGEIPSFPGNTGQVFASYIDPVVLSWRGNPSTTIVGGVATIPYPNNPSTAVIPDPIAALTDAQRKEVLGELDKEEGTGYFYVNLRDYETDSYSGEGGNPTVTVRSFTAGSANGITMGTVSATFAENNARLILGIFPEHVAALKGASGNITITIKGTASPNDTSFRYHIANPFTGQGWNGTNSFDADEIGKFLFVDDDTPNSKSVGFNLRTAPELSYFVLQARAATSTAVTITSIRVDYEVVPDEPIPQATAPFTVNITGAPVKSTETPGGWAALTTLNTAVGNVSFPQGFSLGSYGTLSIVANFYDADGTKVVPGEGSIIRQLGQVAMYSGTDQTTKIKDFFNLGEEYVAVTRGDASVNFDISTLEYAGRLATQFNLNFQMRGAASVSDVGNGKGLGSIELVSITFNPAE